MNLYKDLELIRTNVFAPFHWTEETFKSKFCWLQKRTSWFTFFENVSSFVSISLSRMDISFPEVESLDILRRFKFSGQGLFYWTRKPFLTARKWWYSIMKNRDWNCRDFIWILDFQADFSHFDNFLENLEKFFSSRFYQKKIFPPKIFYEKTSDGIESHFGHFF